MRLYKHLPYRLHIILPPLTFCTTGRGSLAIVKPLSLVDHQSWKRSLHHIGSIEVAHVSQLVFTKIPDVSAKGDYFLRFWVAANCSLYFNVLLDPFVLCRRQPPVHTYPARIVALALSLASFLYFLFSDFQSRHPFSWSMDNPWKSQLSFVVVLSVPELAGQ